MVKLVFVCYGEFEWNKVNFFIGWVDVDFLEKGI